MASPPESPLLTEEQYLELERAAETKSEFHDGRMYAMAGGSLNHSLLSAKIAALLDRQLAAGCRVLSSDLRIKASAAGLYTYPDCSVVCDFVGRVVRAGAGSYFRLKKMRLGASDLAATMSGQPSPSRSATAKP